MAGPCPLPGEAPIASAFSLASMASAAARQPVHRSPVAALHMQALPPQHSPLQRGFREDLHGRQCAPLLSIGCCERCWQITSPAQLLRRHLGAAGVQYGRYVERVLYSPALPAQRTAALILSRVTLGAWNESAPPEAGRKSNPRSHPPPYF